MDTPRSGTSSDDVRRLDEIAQVAARRAAQLLSSQIALAKEDVRSELRDAKSRAVGLAISAMLLVAAVVLLALGVILLLGISAPIVFATGMALASLSLVASFYGTRLFHRRSIAAGGPDVHEASRVLVHGQDCAKARSELGR